MTDDQIDELINWARTATAFSRLSFAECRDVLRWLTHNGHVTFTGKPLEKAPAQQKPRARKPDGSPIYGGAL
jgi:hypothetical protein